MKQTLALGIETSSSHGSLSLCKGSFTEPQSFKCLETVHWSKQNTHSEYITLALKELLTKTQLQTKNLDHIFCGAGPGSFTGIRVGMNLAKTLSYCESIPLSCFTSSEVLGFTAYKKSTPILVLINAFKNLIYASLYNAELEPLLPLQALTVKEILNLQLPEKMYYCGNALELYSDLFSEEFKNSLITDNSTYPDAELLCQYGFTCAKRSLSTSWKDATPIYIRASEAEEKLKLGLLKPTLKKFSPST